MQGDICASMGGSYEQSLVQTIQCRSTELRGRHAKTACIGVRTLKQLGPSVLAASQLLLPVIRMYLAILLLNMCKDPKTWDRLLDNEEQ